MQIGTARDKLTLAEIDRHTQTDIKRHRQANAYPDSWTDTHIEKEVSTKTDTEQTEADLQAAEPYIPSDWSPPTPKTMPRSPLLSGVYRLIVRNLPSQFTDQE